MHVRDHLGYVLWGRKTHPLCVVSSPGLLDWDPEEKEKVHGIHILFTLCLLIEQEHERGNCLRPPSAVSSLVTDRSGVRDQINPSVPRLLLSRVF